MPEFVWRAADASGKIQEGRLEAGALALAQKQLRARGLTPLSIREPGPSGRGRRARRRPRGLAGLLAKPGKPRLGGAGQPGRHPAADLELSIMLRAGLALDNALRVLIGMSHKPRWRR
jgi:general secretion pathway protein F